MKYVFFNSKEEEKEQNTVDNNIENIVMFCKRVGDIIIFNENF